MRVLVATGERHISRLIQVNLERQGHQVLSAYTGVECLLVADKENPELIILDKRLPPIGGLTVFEALAENELTKNIGVIVLGEQGADWPDEGPSGPKKYLQKPNDIFKLFEIVKT